MAKQKPALLTMQTNTFMYGGKMQVVGPQQSPRLVLPQVFHQWRRLLTRKMRRLAADCGAQTLNLCSALT